MSDSASSSSSAPQPPPFFPINIPSTIAQALQYDTQGFDFSDSDFLARFPGLVATRNDEIDRAYNALTGPLDPTLEQSFTRNALSAGINATGGGDPLSGLGMTEGSFGRNVASANLGQALFQNQDYNRNYFDTLIGNNPQRAFGISGSDVANLAIANTGGLNQQGQLQYQSQLAGIYGTGAQDAATGAQIAALGNILARLNFNSGTSGVGARG